MANEPIMPMQEEVLNDAAPVEDTIRFTNPTFVRILSAVMIVLMFINVVSVLRGAWFSIIPLIVQSVVLLALSQRWPRTRTIVRIWAAILTFGGVSGLVEAAMQILSHGVGDSDVLPAGILLRITLNLVFVGGGIVAYRPSGRYIVGMIERQWL